MSNPFIFLDSINNTKVNQMKNTANDELAEKLYKPFFINKSLSYFSDSILYANEMNFHNHLDAKLQYDFLLNTLRKRKRKSSKWVKDNPDESVKMIMEHFGYNRSKAEQALKVLTDEQLAVIERELDRGGKG